MDSTGIRRGSFVRCSLTHLTKVVDRVGLIHFGGRLYDPRLGRFIQADPLVEDANLANGLNRYSYVLNNPLSLTDPSGYLSWSEARPAVAIIINAVMQNWVGVYGFAAQVALGAATGAIGGGSRGAVQGAFGAGLFYGIGSAFQDAASLNNMSASNGKFAGAFGTNLTGAQFAAKVALHGLAGGVMSKLGGGKFGHGFVSAGGTQLASAKISLIGNGATAYTANRIVAAAVVGGSIAEVTGGKFANGAMTSAFAWAFSRAAAGGGEETAEDRMLASAEYDSNTALAYESIGTFYQERAQKDFLAGRIDAAELNDVYRAQAGGVVVGTGMLLTGYGAYQVGSYGAAGVAFGWKNLSFDGPQPGLRHANGRIFGVRWKRSQWGIRLDLHSMKGDPTNTPVLHFNIGPLGRGEANHIPIYDPRWFRGDK